MSLTRAEEQALALGQDVARMIGNLVQVAGGDAAYSRRKITFPGGSVHLFLVNQDALAETFEAAASQNHSVLSVEIGSPSSGAN